MKLVSFGSDTDFNLLPHFPTFIEPYIQKHSALYQLETVLVPIKDNNTETNSYTLLQPRKDYLCLTEEKYISFTHAESDMCKHIGPEYFCKTIFLIKVTKL